MYLQQLKYHVVFMQETQILSYRAKYVLCDPTPILHKT